VTPTRRAEVQGTEAKERPHGAFTPRDVFGDEIGTFSFNEYDGLRGRQVEQRRYTWNFPLPELASFQRHF
jgi:hypothetical protein